MEQFVNHDFIIQLGRSNDNDDMTFEIIKINTSFSEAVALTNGYIKTSDNVVTSCLMLGDDEKYLFSNETIIRLIKTKDGSKLW